METKTQQKISIGTVSHGTLRNEDLIPAFLDELKNLDIYTYARLIRANADIVAWAESNAPVEPEFAGEFVYILIEALNDCSPDYVEFGALKGDSSDFGFWPVLPDDYDPDVIRTSSTPSYLLHVNDHGNPTLYQVELKEIWAVV
jgi:hypothetical protein